MLELTRSEQCAFVSPFTAISVTWCSHSRHLWVSFYMAICQILGAVVLYQACILSSRPCLN